MLEMTPGNFRLADPVVKTIRGELMTYKKAVTLARTVAHYRRGRHELKIGRAVIDTLLPQTVQARTVGRLLTADAAILRTTVTSRGGARFVPCEHRRRPVDRRRTVSDLAACAHGDRRGGAQVDSARCWARARHPTVRWLGCKI